MLSQEELRQYREEGFIVVRSVFSDSELREMRAVIDRLIEESRRVTQHNDIYDLGALHSPETPHVRRIKKPHLVDPVFLAAITAPPLMAILQQLLGKSVRLQSSKLNMKEAGGGEPVEWHQDWAFYPHTNDDMLAVGLMIDDCATENGPLLIVPGSHRGPHYNHHTPEGYFCGAIDPAREKDIDFGVAKPCLGPAGSVSIHHVRAVHGSASNISNAPRRLVLYELGAGDAWPLHGFTNLDDFNSRLLSGEPTLSPRMEAVQVTMPLPPVPTSGSIYEYQSKLKNRYFA